MRASSPTYDNALKGFDGKDAPNLTIQFGDAGKDADNVAPNDGVTDASIQKEESGGENYQPVRDANGDLVWEKWQG